MKKKVFLFSGLGTQTSDMGIELYTENRGFRNIMDDLDASVKKSSGMSVIDDYYGCRDKNSFFSSQAMLFMTQYSLARVLIESGTAPDALAGFSLGEFVAGAVSGALSAKELLGVFYEQSVLIKEKCDEGAALFVNAPPEAFDKYNELFSMYEAEMINAYSKKHFIISGLKKNIGIIASELEKREILSSRLPIFYAFHTHLIDIMRNDIAAVYKKISFSTPNIRIISSVEEYDFPNLNPDYLWQLIRHPIRYAKAVGHCIKEDYIFVDCSPSRSCANFIKYNFKGVSCVPSLLDPHVCRKMCLNDLSEINSIISEQCG